jgi:hypothetical protein
MPKKLLKYEILFWINNFTGSAMMSGFVSWCVLYQFAVSVPHTVSDPDYYV